MTEARATIAPASPPGEAGAAFVEAVRLEKRYGPVRALDDFSLSIARGEVLALVGQNGAGKSTFVRVLAGLERPDDGAVLVDGEPVRVTSPADAETLGFAFVHQQLALVPSQTVEENLFLGVGAPKRLGLVSGRRAAEAASAVLARFDLPIAPRARVSTLSVAHRWMLAIAKSLLRRSRLLVLDEPTAALSPREVKQLFEAVRRLRDDGVAVVYISHRMDEIEQLADRVAVCKDGKMVGAFRPGELSRRELIRMMVGREISEFAIDEPANRGEVPALRATALQGGGVGPVSFDVRPGEIVGFAGLVGSGRTETAELLMGHRRIESGTIEVNGAEFRPRNPGDSVNRGIVLVPEERHDSLFMTRSITHNVSISVLRRLRFRSWAPFVSGRRERAVAARAIADLGVKTKGPSQLVRELSGGNQQKVVLGRWLSRGANVFVFDEPTRGVDVEGKQQIYLLMDELAKGGDAVIFISSELPEVIGISHRLVVFRERATVAELPRGTREEQVLALCYADVDEETR